MKKAFTLIELLVAIGILAMVMSFASVIFRTSIDSYRTASANAEIMRKLRAITDQLNADFKGLRKDGEIFVVWVAKEAVTANYDGYRDCDNDGYERFDRIMFFADGDFQSYGTSPKIVRGNVARICYMLAKNAAGRRAEEYRDPLSLTETGRKLREEDRRERILARTQHIYTDDNDLNNFLDPTAFPHTFQEWYNWNNWLEYDKTTMEQWKNISWDYKKYMLSVISNVKTELSMDDRYLIGAAVNPADPNSIHILLCEGVGEFKVQGWYDAQQRWVPEVDPNGDRILTDSDFFLDDPNRVPGLLYPNPPYGLISLNWPGYPLSPPMSEENFNLIPGLGRALKFTFTLYDSKGVIKHGRTFTHIVYLD